MMKQTALLVLLAASVDASSSSHLRQRQLWGSSSSSSSGSGWSFWGSLLQLLDHMHTPCPPGSLHHKDEHGEPLPPGQCWQDLHHHHHHKSHKSGGGGGGGSSSSSSSSYSFIQCQEGDANCVQNTLCQEGDANCYQFITCADDDQDCFTYITCDDDSSNCMTNVQPAGWQDDGHAATDDATAAVEYDDGWSDDGWTSNASTASYASKGIQNSASTPVWPFLVAALVAGVVGVMFVVSRRKRRSDAEESLNGTAATSSKRKRLFNFGRKKKGSLDEDFDNEDNYVEMSR